MGALETVLNAAALRSSLDPPADLDPPGTTGPTVPGRLGRHSLQTDGAATEDAGAGRSQEQLLDPAFVDGVDERAVLPEGGGDAYQVREEPVRHLLGSPIL